MVTCVGRRPVPESWSSCADGVPQGRHPRRLVGDEEADLGTTAELEDEVAAAKEVVGVNVTPDGVEDFLWAVVVLPEFQLIR